MTTITQLPDPPSRQDPENFPERGDVFLGSLPNFVTETNTVISEINANTGICVSSAAQAAASANIALTSSNFKGAWSSLSGALNKPASVYHNSKYWMLLNNLVNVAASQPGVTGDWAEVRIQILHYTYANRNNCRSLSPNTGDMIIIEGLGLFIWYSGSTEIDDDETCFATASGRWLIEAVSPEMLETLIDHFEADISLLSSSLDTVKEDVRELSAVVSSRILHGSGTSGIGSPLAANTQVSFTITVNGATTLDRVIVVPPNALDYRVNFFARVTALNTVTVYLNNNSAATPAYTDGTWLATVIKV